MMLNKICQKITTCLFLFQATHLWISLFFWKWKWAAFMSVCFSLHWTSCLMAVVIWHDFFFLPLSPYINSERKLAVFCSYVLNSSARQHAECSFWNCDGQIKITTCLSRQNDHSMMLPAEINSAVDSRGDSEAVSAAPTVQVLNI